MRCLHEQRSWLQLICYAGAVGLTPQLVVQEEHKIQSSDTGAHLTLKLHRVRCCCCCCCCCCEKAHRWLCG